MKAEAHVLPGHREGELAAEMARAAVIIGMHRYTPSVKRRIRAGVMFVTFLGTSPSYNEGKRDEEGRVMDIRPGCGMTGFAEASGPLCAGLERLRREHPPLWKRMEELAESARRIPDDAGSGGWRESLRSLEEKVRSFTAELDLHSKREEEVLFPMMAQYIGRETGPIAVMEYEHEQAKARLSEFLSEVEKLGGSAGAGDARRIAGKVEVAVQILSDHFLKEENVLFPMAERILSDAEKEELLERIQAI